MEDPELKAQCQGDPGWLRDALNGVVDLAQQSMRPCVVHVDDMPRDMLAYYVPGEPELKLLTKPLPPRHHTAGSLETLIALAASHSNGIVWYDPDRVALVFDPIGQRQEGAIFRLKHTEVWQRILKLRSAGHNKFDQKGLIRFLRIDMAGCTFGAADKLLLAAKRIKFKKLSESDTRIDHGKSSIGKKLEAEVSGAEDLPEEITVSVPVYQDEPAGAQHYVKLGVEIDLEEGVFALTPLAGEVERIEADSLKNIRIALSSGLPSGYRLYAGCPN